MKKLFNIILLITLCIGFTPAFADVDDNDISNTDESITDDTQETKSFLKEKKKNKKKKGERNVKVQPSIEDDENIILELDRT